MCRRLSPSWRHTANTETRARRFRKGEGTSANKSNYMSSPIMKLAEDRDRMRGDGVH